MNSRCDQSYTADGDARVQDSPAGVAVGATCCPPGPGDTQHSPSLCDGSPEAHDVHWRCNTGKNSGLCNNQFIVLFLTYVLCSAFTLVRSYLKKIRRLSS